MSKLADVRTAGSTAAAAAGTDTGMTAERWLGVFVLVSFGFLVFTRRAFSEFIPR